MMTSRSKLRPAVLVMGPVPPPVTGYAMVTALMTERLRMAAEVASIDISPGSLVRDWRYHARRIRRVSLALGKLVWFATKNFRTVYFGIGGGAGVIYDTLLALVARLCGYRIFVHHHAFSYINQKSCWTGALVAVAGPKATHICLCSTMAQGLKKQYPRIRRTTILSNAVFFAPSEPRAAWPAADPVRIGFLSNLIPDKGLDTVIEVFRRVHRACGRVSLVIAGPAFDPDITALLRDAAAEFGDAFDYRGAVFGDEKARFFRDIDVFLFPTRYANEAQPLVLFEALAAGVPVIATDRGCISCDVTKGGRVFPDRAYLGEAVDTLSRWVNERAALQEASAAASEHAKALYGTASAELEGLIALILQPQ